MILRMVCPMCNLHQNNNYRADPTRTITLRKRFEAEVVRRMKRLRRAILALVVEDRAFGAPGKPITNRENYEFLLDAAKIEAFNRWIRSMQRSGDVAILPIGDASYTNMGWINAYIDSAYQQGIRRAYQEVERAGIATTAGGVAGVAATGSVAAAFNQPIHSDAVAAIYARTYSDLEGITREMDKQISRVLAEGITRGDNPLKIAREMADRVDKIGITRSRMLARTEVIRAHHIANLNSYKQFGIDEVEMVAEFTTAGDSRVCPKCEALDGKIYTIEVAKGLIPVHPNCRCFAQLTLRDEVDNRKIRRTPPK